MRNIMANPKFVKKKPVDIQDLITDIPAEYTSGNLPPSTNPDEKPPLKSVNGRRCISKCYKKRETYFHPIILTAVYDQDIDTCAIDPVHSQDQRYRIEHDMIYTDGCNIEGNRMFKLPDELDSILSSFNFNPADFLSGIYGLNSFDETIYWTMENDHLPFDTIRRVHNCAWRVYGNKIDNITQLVLEYYYDICITSWLPDFIIPIAASFSFETVTDTDQPETIENADEEMMDLIQTEFLTYDFFVKTIHSYIYEFDEKWDTIEAFYESVKIYVFNALVEQMESMGE